MTGDIARVFCLSLVVLGATAGCDREGPPGPPVTIDAPLGPITKTTGAPREGLPVADGAPPVVNYVSNGFVHLATAEDRRAGRSELRVYNPTRVKNDVTMTIYFDNQPPREFARFRLEPKSNDWIVAIPGEHAEFFKGAEAWAARFESTAPIIAANMLSAGVVAPGGDLWFGDPRYKGSNTAAPVSPALSRHWMFSDGLVLQTDNPGPNQRFNEYEWYHVLNPGKAPARVSMHCNYPNGEADTFEFEVGAERVRIVDNRGLFRPNAPCAVEFISSEQVQVSGERFITDFKDTQDWGAWVHTQLPGVPEEQLTAEARAGR